MPLNTHQLIGWTAAHQLLCLHENGTDQAIDTFADYVALLANQDPALIKTIVIGLERAQNVLERIQSPDAA